MHAPLPADGYVRAEAVGALMLALLSEPATHPLLLLAGSAVNQDGRSSSLTAPNGPSQQEAVNAALRAGGLSAWQVAHLQMHGTGEQGTAHLAPLQAACGGLHALCTLHYARWGLGGNMQSLSRIRMLSHTTSHLPCPAGTPLGDPIEVGAAAAVLVEGQNAARLRQPLTLYGSKSWVGHSGEIAARGDERQVRESGWCRDVHVLP